MDMKYEFKTLQQFINDKSFNSIMKESEKEQLNGIDYADEVRYPRAKKRSDLIATIFFSLVVLMYCVMYYYKLIYCIFAVVLVVVLIYNTVNSFRFKIVYDNNSIEITRGFMHTASYKYDEIPKVLVYRYKYQLCMPHAKYINVPKYCIGVERFLEMLDKKHNIL